MMFLCIVTLNMERLTILNKKQDHKPVRGQEMPPMYGTNARGLALPRQEPSLSYLPGSTRSTPDQPSSLGESRFT